MGCSPGVGQSLLYLSLALAMGFACQSALAAESDKRIRAVSSNGTAIVLDGRLNESAWKTAPVSSNFVERTPNPKDEPPVQSRVRVVFDEQALYVAVENDLLPGEEPRALELRRDSGRVWSDDAITLKFDVALDRRTSLNLAVNSAGTQVDAMALNNGRQFRRQFDAVWSSASNVTDGVWTVEFRVPFSALGMSALDRPRQIGFNVTRDHNVRNATYDWAHLPPEFGPSAASHYGQITGLKNVGLTGHPIRFYPFVLLRSPGTGGFVNDDLDLRAGVDVKTRLGAGLWGEATVLTDFAEVDLDDETVNLSRFPLYLPEKRPFFLSGLDVFEFGAQRESQVFFSRRIGIDEDGETVPIWSGLKTYGRIGRFSVGALSVFTAESEVQAQLNDSVGRLLYTSEAGHTLGVIVAGRNSLDGSEETRIRHGSVGIDGSLRLLDTRLTLSGFSAITVDQHGDETLGNSSKLQLNYKGSAWRPYLSVLRTDADFAPKLGFVRRTDALRVDTGTGWIHRLPRGALSSIYVSPSVSELFSADGQRNLGRNLNLYQSVSFRNGFSLGGSVGYSVDVVEEDFTLPTDQEIKADRYGGTSVSLNVSTPWNRTPRLSAEYLWSDAFYGGEQQALYVSVSSYLGSHVRASAGGNYTWFTLPGDDEEQTLTLNSSLTFAATPELFWENNVQGNTVSKAGRIMSRVRWRYLPGSDLFLVYQENAELAGGYEVTDRRFVFKMTYWWDAVL